MNWLIVLGCIQVVAVIITILSYRPIARTWIGQEREFYKHKRRGSFYELSAHATLQSAGPIREGEELVIYVAADGRTWARPSSEFYDGRFERM